MCAVSALILIFVLTLEYGFDIKPCEWCIYERYPYIILLILNLVWIVFRLPGKVLYFLSSFLLAINVMLPFVHVLIEKGYIYVKCSPLKHRGSLQEILNTLHNHTSCAKAGWHFLGWSMAQWHLLFAGAILILYISGVSYVQKKYPSDYKG